MIIVHNSVVCVVKNSVVCVVVVMVVDKSVVLWFKMIGIEVGCNLMIPGGKS
jgi:hypothetical protein